MDINNLGQNDDVFRVLRIFAEADDRESLFWKFESDGEIRLFADCSDLFEWGTADMEEITTDSVPVLEETLKDLKTFGRTGTMWLSELYSARMRQMRPMRAFYSSLLDDETASRHEITELFDACGPERDPKSEG